MDFIKTKIKKNIFLTIYQLSETPVSPKHTIMFKMDTEQQINGITVKTVMPLRYL